jgi:hypothetical protein
VVVSDNELVHWILLEHLNALFSIGCEVNVLLADGALVHQYFLKKRSAQLIILDYEDAEGFPESFGLARFVLLQQLLVRTLLSRR